ncbi:lactate/malate family dehydrogenase, partial [Staphylococcus saprophyticus]
TLDLVQNNTKIFKSILSELIPSPFNPIFLLPTNPLDLLTYLTQQLSPLPKQKLIPSPTILHTPPFKYQLPEQFPVSHTTLHGQIIPQHPHSQL